MNDQKEQIRKAAGSSDTRNSNTSRNQTRSQYERTQAPLPVSPYHDVDSEYGAELLQNSEGHRSSRSGSQSQQHNEQPPAQTRSSQRRSQNSNETPNDEWDMIPPVHHTPNTTSPPPSYEFPGTWDAALHETTTALGQVSLASKSYATALSQSGIGKAGWSIGSALLSSTNKGALNLAGWAVDKADVDTTQLPAPVKKWLKGKDKLEEAKARARQAEERRKARRVDEVMRQRGREPVYAEPVVFGDEEGAFVLETHHTNDAGEFVGDTRPAPRSDDGWDVALTHVVPVGDGGGDGEVGDDEEKTGEEGRGDGLVRML